jgi:hypothetical protein
LLYTRDAGGEYIEGSFEAARVRDLRVDMFGDQLAIIEHQTNRGLHLRLFYLESKREMGAWTAPFTYFCLEDEEIDQCL